MASVPRPAAVRLARWAAALTPSRIPARVAAAARRALIDTVAVILAGSRTPLARAARAHAAETFAPGPASILGDRRQFAPAGAAFANGVAAHALDFDDNCYAGFVHGSAVIVPAVLAVAEARDLSGADLVAAFVAGCEAEFAVGAALTDSIYRAGWWTTGVLGPIGAAVAASRALGLDAARTAHALGLAVAGTGGIKAMFGTDGKPLLCGRAAEQGVTAAYLAAQGRSGPENVFEDSRGFANLFNAGVFEADALDGLGRRWRLLDPGVDIKRIPVCLSAHAAVDSLMDLVAAENIPADAVERVICEVGPVVAGNLVYPRPASVQQAQFSLEFAVACALVHGDTGLEHLTPATLADRRLKAAMARVEMRTPGRWAADPTLASSAPEGAHVTILLKDGRKLEKFNAMGRGTTARPITDDELAAKFRACARGTLGRASADSLLAALAAIDTIGSVRALIGGVRGDDRRPARAVSRGSAGRARRPRAARPSGR